MKFEKKNKLEANRTFCNAVQENCLVVLLTIFGAWGLSPSSGKNEFPFITLCFPITSVRERGDALTLRPIQQHARFLEAKFKLWM